MSAAVRRLLERLQAQRARHLALQIVRQGIDHGPEADWLQNLVEDSSPAGASYCDFLVRLHGQVIHDLGSISTSILTDKAALLSFFH